mmetsp:Transcript_24290/g.37501  ORF Transcript_24290/g.37501 Transcript_24290/m.37501 type:complete len:147 (+) Transcript_24290:808-1248(+)
MDDLLLKLHNTDRQNDDLKQQILALKRIQNEQSRALSKMVFENDYPQKIKGLVDELQYSKDKIRELGEELKREKRVSQQVQYNNSVLIEQVRTLKQKLMTKMGRNTSMLKSDFTAFESLPMNDTQIVTDTLEDAQAEDQGEKEHND